MAYTLKYKLEVKGKAKGLAEGLNDASLKDIVFEIYELDPIDGTVTILKSKKEDAPLISFNSNKGDIDFQYISSQATLSFIKTVDANLYKFVTEDERKFLGVYKVDGNIVFKGWIFIDFSDQNINSINSTVTLRFSDGIGTLENQSYLDENGNKYFGNASINTIIKNILLKVGLDLNFVTGSVLKSNTVDTSIRPFDAYKINQNRFAGLNCKQVLEILCTTYFAHFYQKDGMFWFVPFDRNRQLSKTLNKFSPAGTFIENITLSTVKEVGSDKDITMGAHSGLERLPAPYKKTSISTYVPKGELFDNGYLEVYNVGSSSPLTANFLGIGTQENNVAFPGWTIAGTLKITCITYSQEYMSALAGSWNALDGNSQYGAFPQNNKVFVLDRAASTAGATITSSKYFIRKGTVINFSTAAGHSLKIIGLQAENLKYHLTLTTKEGIKYFLGQDSKWSLSVKRIKVVRNNYKLYIDSNPDPYEQDSALTGLNSSGTQNVMISLNLESQPTIVDGFLEIQMISVVQGTFPNEMMPFYQFQAPIVTIVSQPKGIEKVIYETSITGKHTVIDTEYTVPICDNSLELVPCSVFDQNNIETEKYINSPLTIPSDLLLIPLVTKALQFSRRKTKIRIDVAYTHNIKICDLVQFNDTDYPLWTDKEFMVIDITNYNIADARMTITMIEVVENGAVDYEVYYNDQNNFKNVIRSGSVDIDNPPTPTLYSPWLFANITNSTGSAYHPDSTNLSDIVINGTGGDVWENSDDLNFVYRTGGNKGLEGVLLFGNEPVDDNAKIGIMYRESLDNDARFYGIFKRKDGYVLVMVRDTVGGAVNMITHTPNGQNVDRFKITHIDGVLKSYYNNGAAWFEYNTDAMVFDPTNAKIGFITAMIGDTNTVTIDNAIYTDLTPQSVTKPAGLIAISTQVKSEVTSSGEITKPLNLIAISTQVKSAGDPVVGSEPVPSMGFHVLTFNQKAGMRFFQTGPEVIAMKLEANLGAGTVTDTAYNWKPTLRDANGNLLTVYIKWKMNTGKWHGVYPGGDGIRLENIVIPAGQRGKQTTFTKYPFTTDNFYQPKKYPLQQVIILNAT